MMLPPETRQQTTKVYDALGLKDLSLFLKKNGGQHIDPEIKGRQSKITEILSDEKDSIGSYIKSFAAVPVIIHSQSTGCIM